MNKYKRTKRNLARMSFGATAFDAYVKAWEEDNYSPASSEGWQTIFSDFMSDLRHYAASKKIDFDRAVALSEANFVEESQGLT